MQKEHKSMINIILVQSTPVPMPYSHDFRRLPVCLYNYTSDFSEPNYPEVSPLRPDKPAFV